MFDRLFDLIHSIWEWLIPFTTIDCYEMGVVLRFGKYKRTIGPGLRWLWPLGIETVRYDTVVRQTSYLDVQSLTSEDGKNVTINGILIYRISDIRKFLLEIDDGETDVQNICYGIITQCVESHFWEDIIRPEFNITVFDNCRAACSEYCGVELIALQWSDKAVARNLRLWND